MRLGYRLEFVLELLWAGFTTSHRAAVAPSDRHIHLLGKHSGTSVNSHVGAWDAQRSGLGIEDRVDCIVPSAAGTTVLQPRLSEECA